MALDNVKMINENRLMTYFWQEIDSAMVVNLFVNCAGLGV